jgi:dienelactone hydrolase
MMLSLLAAIVATGAGGDGETDMAEGIHANQMGTFALRLCEQSGEPFSGAEVSIRQIGHESQFGCRAEDDDCATLMDGPQNPYATPQRAVADASGNVTFKGFYGDYEIILDGHVWKPRLASDGPREFELRKPPTVEPPERFELPFLAQNPAEARRWQEQVRARLFEIVSAQNPKNSNDLKLEFSEQRKNDKYTTQDISFEANEGPRIEATLTLPVGEGPFPAVVCLHGHGGNREAVHDPASIYHALGAEYAGRGFVTIAPSLDHYDYAPNQLWNLIRLVDVLETLDAVDKDRIGVAGLSMGGEWTMWLATMDLRIKAAVVSGWMCTTEGVLSIHNCPCWMPPGLLELCDIAEVHILVAPRPLLFESAIGDGCFPIRCTEEGYRKVLKGYSVLEAPENVRQHTFPGGHAWNGGVAYDFMSRALGIGNRE